MSLYLKFRPQTFTDLVGQDQVSKTLKRAFEKNMVNHAYLFCGPRGTGKTSTARILAKSLNCLNYDAAKGEPCNECDICKAINEAKLIDIVEIDAASNRGIDEIRELRDTIKFAPTQAKNKIYIVDEVHMLTKEAFNALLKTLEEPPENVFFILATTEAHKIPETIVSRCQRFDFKRIGEKAIADRLAFIAEAEGFETDSEALDLIARYVNGGMRDAIGILEQMAVQGSVKLDEVSRLLGSTDTKSIDKLVELLIGGSQAEALELVANLYEDGVDLSQLAKDMVLGLRASLLSAIKENDVAAQSRIVKLLGEWQQTSETFKNCDIPQLGLEVFITKTCQNLEDAPLPKPVAKKSEVEVEKSKSKPEVIVEPKVVDEPVVEAKTEETPGPKVTEEIDAPSEEVERFEGNIDEAWKNLLKNINQPIVKRSLQQGKVKQITANEFVISFSSQFHFETINNAENLGLAEKAFKEVSGVKAKFSIEKIDAPAAPAPEQFEETPVPVAAEAPMPVQQDQPKVDTRSDQELIDEALALFEGEIVLE
jgi:DNA polymerase-3 subunit gamma/tau